MYYEYEKTGLKTRLTDPLQAHTYYTYDVAMRLERVNIVDSGSPRKVYYAYDKAGLLTRRAFPDNRVLAYYTYDTAARLARLENRDSSLNVITYFAYVRNANGAIEYTKREGGKQIYYQFDEIDRLTSERWKDTSGIPIYGFNYSYDAVCNRLTKTDEVNVKASYYEYDTRNLLGSEFVLQDATTVHYEYDLSQRLKTRYSASEATYFAHNFRNMVVQLDNVAAIPEARRIFKYTGVGERVIVQDSEDSITTYWAYDGRELLLQRETSGESRGRYRHNDLAQDSMGSLIEVELSHEPEFGLGYPSFDERASLIQLRGNAVNRYEYDFHGVSLGEESAVFQPFQYASLALTKLGLSRHPSYLRHEILISKDLPVAFGGILGSLFMPLSARFTTLPLLSLLPGELGPASLILPFWVCVCALDPKKCDIDLSGGKKLEGLKDQEEEFLIPAGPKCWAVTRLARRHTRTVRYAVLIIAAHVKLNYYGARRGGDLARGCHLRQDAESYINIVGVTHKCVYDNFVDDLKRANPRVETIPEPYVTEGVRFWGARGPIDYGRGELGAESDWKQRWVHFFDAPGATLRSLDYYRGAVAEFSPPPYRVLPYVKAHLFTQLHVTVEEVPPKDLEIYWGLAGGVDWNRNRTRLVAFPKPGEPKNIKRFPFLVI